MKLKLTFALAALFMFAQIGWAQIPKTMSYQGVLMDADGSLVNGTYQAKFRLYNVETGGSAEWTDEQEISITDGLLNVILGSDINPISVSFEQQYWLGLTLGDSELSPRIQLTSSAYSFNALSVVDSSITGNKIVNAQVVRSINSQTDNVTIAAGANVSITESNDTLYVSATGGSNSSVGGAGATGQVAYWDDVSTLSGDTEFYWDITSKNLGLGTSKPTEKLTLGGDILFTNSVDRVIAVQPETESPTERPIGKSLTILGGGDLKLTSHDSLAGSVEIRESRTDFAPVGGGVLINGGGRAYIGGNISVHAGEGYDVGGIVSVKGGEGMYSGGNVAIDAGDGTGGYGGYLTLKAGSGPERGGDIHIISGVGERGPHGSISLVSNKVYVKSHLDSTQSELELELEVDGVIASTIGGFKFPDGSIQKSSASFSIPFMDTVDIDGVDGLSVTHRGNTTNGGLGAIAGYTTGSMYAIYGCAKGTGAAGVFEIKNENNNLPALIGRTNGIGPAMSISQSGASGNIADFISDNQRQVVITKTGSMGIGTTTPLGITASRKALHLRGGITPAFVLEQSDEQGAAARKWTISTFASDGSFNITDRTANAGAQFVIRPSGNIGIGTSDVSNIITVKQGAPTRPIADSWEQYSSRRWKKNIKTLDNALGKVQKLRGVSYDLKSNDEHEIGLIAEEVGEVLPEVVRYEENGVDAKSIDYARMVAVVIEAVKDQQSQIEEQRHQIQVQQKQIEHLQNLIRAESR